MIGKITLLAAESDHPNKAPFSGLLTWLGVASDNPVGGAKGRKVVIPVDIGTDAVSSLEGMAVNVRSDLSGHDPTTKVGIIEKAWTGDPDENGAVPIFVEGYLFAKDFPDLVDELHAESDELGFSYEVDARYDITDANTITLTSCVFTGAAILYKNKAAYTNTQLAAESEENGLNEEQVKAILKAMMDEAMGGDMGGAMASMEECLKMFKALKEAFEEAGVYTSLSMYLSAAAENATKVEELTTKVAALETALNDAQTKLTASADNAPNLDGYVKVDDYNALKASFDEMKAKVDVDHAALQAEADEKAKYERASVDHWSTRLMAKYDAEGDSLEAAMAKIDEDTSLSIEDRMTLKARKRDEWARNQNK